MEEPEIEQTEMKEGNQSHRLWGRREFQGDSGHQV